MGTSCRQVGAKFGLSGQRDNKLGHDANGYIDHKTLGLAARYHGRRKARARISNAKAQSVDDHIRDKTRAHPRKHTHTWNLKPTIAPAT